MRSTGSGFWPGRLGIAARPRGGDWLIDELRSWRKAGVHVVVSLLTPDEERDRCSPRQTCYALWAHLEDRAMEPLDVFTVRDLRQRSGDLLRDAAEGRLALITKHGRPAILAVPFDERLLSLGLHRTLALELVAAGRATLSQGARLADMPLEVFIELLGQHGIAAVDYPPEELEHELAVSSSDS